MALAISACKKKDKEKPIPTRNVLTCKINGTDRTYEGPIGSFISDGDGVDLDTLGTGNNHEVEIRALSRIGTIDDISLYVTYETDVVEVNKRYALNNRSPRSEYSVVNSSGTTYFGADSTMSYVVFTHVEKGLIQGAFEQYGTSKDNENIAITGGDFTIRN